MARIARLSDDYDEIVDTNLRGSFLLGRAVATVMREHDGGNIVNIGTDHVFPLPGVDVHGHGAMDLYNASKWALNGLASEWAAPSMLFSIARPARAAACSIRPRASISFGASRTRGQAVAASRNA